MFVLDHNTQVPFYAQLYRQFRAHVLSGKLATHVKLPSVRGLAGELSISRNTVETCYQELLAEGYIYSKPRSGYFVSTLDQGVAAAALPYKPGRAKTRPESPVRYDFHPARLDRESFPAPLWRKLFVDSLRENSSRLAQAGDILGDWDLRHNVQSYLERSRGVVCGPEQVVICSGLQHSLGIIAKLLQDRHHLVAVEDPGYNLSRTVFRNHALTVFPVPVESDGLDMEALKSSGSTLVYVTPSHQYPMGYVMPIACRLKLIEWSDSGEKYIIEDDYDSELRYHGKPIPSVQGLRPGGNIIYLGSFSKIFSPALRMSYMVLPRPLLAAHKRRFKYHLSTVSLLEQRTLARFMEQGHWDRHVRRMRMRYKKKHDVLLDAVERCFGNRAVVTGQGAGLHVVLRLLDNPFSERELLRRAIAEGIHLLPLSSYFERAGSGSISMLLGFGGMSAGEIEQGIGLLSRIWRP
jgi:GntR family transcriptional regulator/MocR family aminotransferase